MGLYGQKKHMGKGRRMQNDCPSGKREVFGDRFIYVGYLTPSDFQNKKQNLVFSHFTNPRQKKTIGMNMLACSNTLILFPTQYSQNGYFAASEWQF